MSGYSGWATIKVQVRLFIEVTHLCAVIFEQLLPPTCSEISPTDALPGLQQGTVIPGLR